MFDQAVLHVRELPKGQGPAEVVAIEMQPVATGRHKWISNRLLASVMEG